MNHLLALVQCTDCAAGCSCPAPRDSRLLQFLFHFIFPLFFYLLFCLCLWTPVAVLHKLGIDVLTCASLSPPLPCRLSTRPLTSGSSNGPGLAVQASALSDLLSPDCKCNCWQKQAVVERRAGCGHSTTLPAWASADLSTLRPESRAGLGHPQLSGAAQRGKVASVQSPSHPSSLSPQNPEFLCKPTHRPSPCLPAPPTLSYAHPHPHPSRAT